jgi:fatty-acyl-CoA synthase
VDAFARSLLSVGVRHGDRVALLVTNRPEWIICTLAAAKMGAIVAAISTFSTPRELAWSLEHCGAVAMIMLEAFRGRHFLDALRVLCPELGDAQPGELKSARLPALRTVVAVDGQAPAGVFSLPEFLARGALVNPASLAATQRTVRPDDICYILYTSGSTAAPKGVTLAHGGVIANGFDIGERMHLSAADRVWLSVPLFWSFGSANALPAALTHGSCIVLQESFDAGEALALIERERCSIYYGMPNMARALLEHQDHPERRGAMRTADHRPARRYRNDDQGAGCRRPLQCLWLDRDLWKLRGDGCARLAAAQTEQPRAAASRYEDPSSGSRDQAALVSR